MKKYYFYSKYDLTKESIGKCVAMTRYRAAAYFASRKQLSLKSFLALYCVSR